MAEKNETKKSSKAKIDEKVDEKSLSDEQKLAIADKEIAILDGQTVVFEKVGMTINFLIDEIYDNRIVGRMMKANKVTKAQIYTAPSALKTALNNLRIAVGDLITIKYLGEKINLAQTYKFKSFVVKLRNKDGSWITSKEAVQQ